jgi:hypothetical protein
VQVRSYRTDDTAGLGGSNAQVASHRTYRTGYALVPSVLHDGPFHHRRDARHIRHWLPAAVRDSSRQRGEASVSRDPRSVLCPNWHRGARWSKVVGRPDSQADGRHPDTFRMMNRIGAPSSTFPREERMSLLAWIIFV